MSRMCSSCTYYETADSTCRENAPSPGQGMFKWPVVAATDWCAQGYNPQDGSYNLAPGAAWRDERKGP
jgi:hypothetical protein